MRSTATVAGVLSALLMSAAACSSTPAQPNAGSRYVPRPDRDLFTEIRSLPGVTQSRIQYLDTPNAPNAYVGRIRVASTADPRRILDRANAILWQGRPGAAEAGSIEVARPGGVAVDDIDLGLSQHSDWVKRYGRHPGDGHPRAKLSPG